MFLIKKILDNSTHNSAESKQDNQKKKIQTRNRERYLTRNLLRERK